MAKYQTGIVGLVGFAGVIITLVVNAWIARRQAREAREHERETLSCALLAELRSIRRSAPDNARRLREVDSSGGSEVAIPAMAIPVFDANVARVGLLRAERVGPVLEAYTLLKEFDRRYALLTRPDLSGHYRVLDGQHAEIVAAMQESHLPRLDAAIAALES